MFNIISEIGVAVASNIAQLIVGCLLSVPIYYLAPKLIRDIKSGFAADAGLIFALSILGAFLPLGPYGALPIFAALIASGTKSYISLPLLISNTVFNMLIPYNDVSFVWRTGMKRVVLAVLAAVLAGMALRMIKDRVEGSLRLDAISALGKTTPGIRNIPGMLARNISFAGPYLVIGVIFDYVFHKFIWWDILNFITHNSYTSFVPGFFAQYNVANPFFLLAMIVVFILLDFARTSSYMLIFRFKGLVAYYVYFAAWAILLGLSAFV